MEEPVTFCHGRYRDLVVLRRGHYGSVYDAEDIKTGQRVALKVLTLTGTHREVAEEMVKREVTALEGFAHPAVARLLGHFEEREANRLGIVLELIPGGMNLEALIRGVREGREERRPFRWCIEKLAAILDAIDRVHQRHIIHRDIKPSNVLFHREEDVLKLADFGVALLLENFGRGEGGRTLREFYTRPFAAPEQVLKQGAAVPATDLHAFGLLASSLLSWQMPGDDFQREGLGRFLEPVRQDLPDGNLFERLSGILSALLNPEPGLRPKTADVERLFQELLDRTITRTPIRVRMTNSAQQKAGRAGVHTAAAILNDLNAGLRVRYDVEPSRDGKPEGFNLHLWGKTLWGLAKPSEPGSTELVLVDAGANPPQIHERQKENEKLAPFTLSSGRGDGSALIAFAYQNHLAKAEEEETRRKQESLFQLAEKVLEKERERLTHILVHYELAAEKADNKASDQYKAKTGEFVKLHVLQVSVPADEQGQTTELGDDWYQELEEDSSFSFGGRELGRFFRFDGSTRTLYIRAGSPLTIPRRGMLEYKDIGTETSLDRQEGALALLYRDRCTNPRLRHLLLFPERNQLGEIRPRNLLQLLEPMESMRDMVERAVAAEDFFLVQGPPGTGKTTFISEVMAQLLRVNPQSRILLTSQANEAVDNALDSLRILARTHGPEWRIVRFHGNQKDEEGIGFGVVFREWVEKVRGRSNAALSKLENLPGGVDIEAVRRALADWQDRLPKYDDAREDFASTVQVFGLTCLKVPVVGRRLLRSVEFDRVIVDEAAKATPTEVLVSLTNGRRFILVGDHRQLPPYLDNQTEEGLRAEGLDPQQARKSLFEDVFEHIPEQNRCTLGRQFRMHRSIGQLVSDLYYPDVNGGRGLEHGVRDEERTLELQRFNQDHRVFWIDVRGHEKRDPDSTSWWNREEVDIVRRLLDKVEFELLSQKNQGLRVTKYSCGVIAAYTAQRDRLLTRVVPTSKNWSHIELQVATVDAFQGKQKDIIIYSMVRSGEAEMRWVSDQRRLNVAFSRAKRLLVIVGNRESALRSERLAQVLDSIPQANILSPEEALR